MAGIKDDREFFEKDRDEWRDKARALKVELDREIERTRGLEAINSRSRELEVNGEDAWRWVGDGEDHLESMSGDMAVLIRAGDLRKLIKREVSRRVGRRFLVKDGKSIPWEMIAPHERQCDENHGGQTLERLAQRGGLTAWEVLLVLDGKSIREIWRKSADERGQAAIDACEELERRREDYEGYESRYRGVLKQLADVESQGLCSVCGGRGDTHEQDDKNGVNCLACNGTGLASAERDRLKVDFAVVYERVSELERRADVLSHQAVDRLDMMQRDIDEVMQSVDRWFDDDDVCLQYSPSRRAAVAREIALGIIQDEQNKRAVIEKAGKGLVDILDRMGLFVDDIPEGRGPEMYYTGSAHGDRLMKTSYLAHRRAMAGEWKQEERGNVR